MASQANVQLSSLDIIWVFFFDRRSLENPKRDSLDKENDDSAKMSTTSTASTATTIVTPPKIPDDPRCKVCFKNIEEKEFFRLCSGCVRKVCEDCSASYTNKDEPEVSIAKPIRLHSSSHVTPRRAQLDNQSTSLLSLELIADPLKIKLFGRALLKLL